MVQVQQLQFLQVQQLMQAEVVEVLVLQLVLVVEEQVEVEEEEDLVVHLVMMQVWLEQLILAVEVVEVQHV